MVDYVNLGIFLLICVLLVYLGYDMGHNQGEKSLRARSDLIRPSLREVQVEGKYLMDSLSLEEIRNKLLNSVDILAGYASYISGNRIVLRNKSVLVERKEYFKKMEETRHGIPRELALFFNERLGNKYEVETLCLSMMYFKITQQVKLDYIKSDIEDAQESCIKFTKEVMNCLNAKVLKEPNIKSIDKKIVTNFIYNTPKDNYINDKAIKIIQEAKYEILYCGWIDRTFLGLLEKAKEKGVNIKIITKDPASSDKLIKEDYQRLIKGFKENLKKNQLFHDRFILSEDKLIIGSMYLTSSSRTRYESGIYTEDFMLIEEAKKHFELIWNDLNSLPFKT